MQTPTRAKFDIAFAKSNEDSRNAVNHALGELRDSGEFASLRQPATRPGRPSVQEVCQQGSSFVNNGGTTQAPHAGMR
jgi:hypothetical protein